MEEDEGGGAVIHTVNERYRITRETSKMLGTPVREEGKKNRKRRRPVRKRKDDVAAELIKAARGRERESLWKVNTNRATAVPNKARERRESQKERGPLE